MQSGLYSRFHGRRQYAQCQHQKCREEQRWLSTEMRTKMVSDGRLRSLLLSTKTRSEAPIQTNLSQRDFLASIDFRRLRENRFVSVSSSRKYSNSPPPPCSYTSGPRARKSGKWRGLIVGYTVFDSFGSYPVVPNRLASARIDPRLLYTIGWLRANRTPKVGAISVRQTCQATERDWVPTPWGLPFA